MLLAYTLDPHAEERVDSGHFNSACSLERKPGIMFPRCRGFRTIAQISIPPHVENKQFSTLQHYTRGQCGKQHDAQHIDNMQAHTV